MSRVYRFRIDTPDILIHADDEDTARKEAEDRLEQYSGSNDGSEMLANADLKLMGFFDCDHAETRLSEFNVERSVRVDGQWTMTPLHLLYEICKHCHKQIRYEETAR